VHTVQPSVLSPTQATETGSVYRVELAGIAADARLQEHMDGARFTNAVARLGCSPADLTWPAGVDLLSLGATKNGTMTTDAIVVFDRTLSGELAVRAKRAGQLTSKMRFQAARLDAYLTDDLSLRHGQHADAMAERLEQGLRSLEHVLIHAPVDANMVFATLHQDVVHGLLEAGFRFYLDRWTTGVVRLVTSFATTPRHRRRGRSAHRPCPTRRAARLERRAMDHRRRQPPRPEQVRPARHPHPLDHLRHDPPPHLTPAQQSASAARRPGSRRIIEMPSQLPTGCRTRLRRTPTPAAPSR
jgi:threonine aldolase